MTDCFFCNNPTATWYEWMAHLCGKSPEEEKTETDKLCNHDRQKLFEQLRNVINEKVKK